MVQAQHYCRGRFDVWDPKITTFPGLYIVAAVYAHAMRAGSRFLSMFTQQEPLTLVRLFVTFLKHAEEPNFAVRVWILTICSKPVNDYDVRLSSAARQCTRAIARFMTLLTSAARGCRR